MRVTLYSRPGCHLCDDLKAALAALEGDVAFTRVERNIEDDPQDMERYCYLIPVLDIRMVRCYTRRTSGMCWQVRSVSRQLKTNA